MSSGRGLPQARGRSTLAGVLVQRPAGFQLPAVSQQGTLLTAESGGGRADEAVYTFQPEFVLLKCEGT